MGELRASSAIVEFECVCVFGGCKVVVERRENNMLNDMKN